MRNFSYLLLVIFCLTLSSSSLSAKTDKYRAMWRDDPSTTMVIGWNQISGIAVAVHYDIHDFGVDVLAYEHVEEPTITNRSKGMNNYFVRLKNLMPSTTYYFVIKDSEGCSERMSFETAPDNPYERLSIIAGGDSRNFRAARQKANRMVAKLRPHCVMFGGDMTGGDNAVQWNAWFNDWQETITSEGRLTPLIITRGNHEYSNKTLTNLFDVAPPEAYYALSIGGNLLRIYTLNSLIPSGGNQKAWLEKDLQASEHFIWKAAQYHFAIRPHTSKKSERNNQLRDWSTLFEKYQVNLAVESDAHCVKWTYPIRPSRESGSDEGFIRDDIRGTVYVGEGCWGAPLRKNNDDKKWTRDSGSFNQFKWIFIDQDRIEIRTVKTDHADQVAALDPGDLFSIPEGIELWNPTNGKVIVIEKQYGEDTPPRDFAYNQFTAKGNDAEKEEMILLDFQAEKKTEGVLVSWKTENESTVNKIFEIQKSIDGLPFKTITTLKSRGLGNQRYDYFEIQNATIADKIAYRIREGLPNSKFKLYHSKVLEDISVPKISSVEASKMNKLIPEMSNGMIRAKYVVEESANIAIRLEDQEDKIVARSDYTNQRSGNYMQSIDMNALPQGQYMLTIKANEEVIQKYLVVK